MISYDQALEMIATAAQPLPSRTARSIDALGCAAATDVFSTVSVPSFANAAMDGFALRSADVRDASPASPVELAVAGIILTGQAPAAAAPGTTWEITTGAAMPAGCDAVLPVERATRLRNGGRDVLRVTAALQPGQNRREAGTDFAPGDRLLRRGDRIAPQTLMALAAIGVDRIEVRGPPRIAVITTGSELRSAGLPDEHGTIRDTNGPYLAAMLREIGIPLVSLQSIPDDPEQLAQQLDLLAHQADLVLTTGGVSAGRMDFVPALVERTGGEILFHKVAIRPGKPLLFARTGAGPLLFGLPGNPMAVAVGLRFFVLPAVRALMAQAAERHVAARCADTVRKREELTFFAKAAVTVTPDAALQVEVLPGQESFRISPLVRANCWAIIPQGLQDVGCGELVKVAPLVPGQFPATAAE